MKESYHQFKERNCFRFQINVVIHSDSEELQVQVLLQDSLTIYVDENSESLAMDADGRS